MSPMSEVSLCEIDSIAKEVMRFTDVDSGRSSYSSIKSDSEQSGYKLENLNLDHA